MEQVLIEEEKKAEDSRHKQRLKEIFKEIRKAIKKQKKEEKASIDKEVEIKAKPSKNKDARHYGINLEEIRQIDYSKLFDYLGSLKPNQHQYGSSDYGKESSTSDPAHGLRQKTLEFIRQKKMDKITGNNHDFEISSRSDAYFWFKLVHGKGVTELLYDLSFT